MMETNAKIYVAGHRGLVGSSIWRQLEAAGYTNLVGRTSAELDLRDQKAVEAFFDLERPEYVFLAAARVGGIAANNTYRAEFIYDNLMIQSNVIHQSWRHGVKRLLFLGSTCIYPRDCPQPMKEEYLLTGRLEDTNEPYAIAKIAGMKMCESYNRQYGTDFISVMPTNLYGPNDNFDAETSHVLPGVMRKMHLAKNRRAGTLTLWGTGTPLREFLWVDDMADACIYLMTHCGLPLLDKEGVRGWYNLGTGTEVSIADLAQMIKEVVGFTGDIVFDRSHPDGTPRKLTDVSRIHALGWKHTVELREGLERLYAWYVAHTVDFTN